MGVGSSWHRQPGQGSFPLSVGVLGPVLTLGWDWGYSIGLCFSEDRSDTGLGLPWLQNISLVPGCSDFSVYNSDYSPSKTA